MQDVRDRIIELMGHEQRPRAYERHYRGPGGGDGREQDVHDLDCTDAERPRKQRYESTLDVWKVNILLIVDDRKISPTQPGQGIRKIVDLYHDLADVLDKAKKHHTILNEENPETIEDMNRIDFIGMSEDEVEEEQKEYAHLT
jgi:hypothetical protein